MTVSLTLTRVLKQGLSVDKSVRFTIKSALPGENRMIIYNELKSIVELMRNENISRSDRELQLSKHWRSLIRIWVSDIGTFRRLWRTIKRSINFIMGRGFVTSWDQLKKIEPCT